MSVGGYQIIDLKNFKFIGDNSDSFTIDGIYDKIAGTKKPILITGLYVNNTKAQNFYCYPIVGKNECVITTPKIDTYAYTITITRIDTIKVMYIQTA